MSIFPVSINKVQDESKALLYKNTFNQEYLLYSLVSAVGEVNGLAAQEIVDGEVVDGEVLMKSSLGKVLVAVAQLSALYDYSLAEVAEAGMVAQ